MHLLVAVLGPLLLSGPPDARLEGMVRDIGGTAISGASIILRKTVSREEMGRTQTDPSGAFVYPQLPEGEYAMQVEAVGFMTVAVDSFRLRPAEHKVLPPISMQTGYGCGDPVLRRLKLLEVASGDRGTLSGVIQDAKERPVAGASVSLICEGQGPCGNTVTDAAGGYAFPSQPVGKYAVRIQARGFYLDERRPYLAEPGYDAAYWPVLLERCRGHGCESKARRKKSNCE